MFRRPHHQRIAAVLQALNADLLLECRCFFAGGTAIVLALDEYRESVDIDFLCASADGYRKLRDILYDRQLAGLSMVPLKQLRELRADQYGVRTFLERDGVPIKFEIVREARVELSGALDHALGVPVLARDDMYAEKLLANTDRGRDISTRHRDIIDLAMMIHRWGPIPEAAWVKASTAYGHSVGRAYRDVQAYVCEGRRLHESLLALQMDIELIPVIRASLESCLAAASRHAA